MASVSSAGSSSSQALSLFLLQQSLAFEATADTPTDQLNQFLQLALIRGLDALKSEWSVVDSLPGKAAGSPRPGDGLRGVQPGMMAC